MQYHTLFLSKFGKKSQNLSSAAVMIGALRVNFKKQERSYEKMVFWPVAKVVSIFSSGGHFAQQS